MSVDFDPRTLWDRRQVLATGLAAGGLSSGAALAAPPPGAALFVAGAEIGAGAAARMAHAAGGHLIALPAQADMVRVWGARIAPLLRDDVALMGVTGWADALMLRGLAAEMRRRVRYEVGPSAVIAADPASASLARALDAAMIAGAPDTAGRVGWILT